MSSQEGINMRICEYGMPGQALYSIHVLEEEEDKEKKSYPGLLTIKEGVANEALIDAELKHLFKGKSGWSVRKIDEDNFMFHFPSAELRDELIKFKGFEFATTIIKAKVVPTEVEKEAVSILEETWVKAISFPKKAKKSEVIKKIAHLVGDPLEVDDKLLKDEGKIRVNVLCKDATKIKGNTLLYINGQGYLLRWYSEKL
jgi:hypothetical protein